MIELRRDRSGDVAILARVAFGCVALTLMAVDLHAAAVPYHCPDSIILTGDKTEDAWRRSAPSYLFDPSASSPGQKYPWIEWAQADPAGKFEIHLPTTVTLPANQLRGKDNRPISLEDAIDPSESHHFYLIIGKLDNAKTITLDQRLAALNYFEYLYHVYKHRLGVYPATESTRPERAGKRYKIFVLVTNTGVPGALASGTAVSAGDGKAGLVGPKAGFPRRITEDGFYWGWAHELGHGVRFDEGLDLYRLEDQPGEVKRAFHFGFLSEAHTQWLSLRAHYDVAILGTERMKWAWKRFGPIHGEFLGQKYHSFWIYEQLALEPDLGVRFVRDIHAQRHFDPNRPLRTVWDRANDLIKSPRYKNDPKARIGDQFALMAARMATMDFPAGEMWLQKIGHFRDRHSRMIFFTHPDRLPDRPGWWAPPLWRTPRPTGYNLIPLRPEGRGPLTVELDGPVDSRKQSDWSAVVAARHKDGRRTYSRVIHRGESLTHPLAGDETEVFLAVAAAPGRYLPQAAKETTGTSLGLGDGRTQEGVVVPMPYRVRLQGARPRDLVAEEHAAMTRGLIRHPNGGGLVEHRDNVDATAWIGPNARVLGNAQVRGRARIEDFALVQDEAVVRGRAVVRGHAWVTEQSVVEDEARVEDFAILQKNAHLAGRSRAGEGVLVDAAASDLAMMEGLGNAGGRLRGNVLTDGPFTWGKMNYSHGVVLFPGVAQAEYPNTRGLYLNYDAEQEHPIFLLDGHGVNHSIKEGEVSAVMDTQIDSRVLSFDGKNDFVRIPARAADFIDSTWRLRVKRDGAARATLLEFAGTTEDGRRTRMRLNTDLRLLLASGSDEQTLASKTPLPIGRWCAVEVDFNGDEATIRLDGQVVARGAMKPNPEDIRAEAGYLGRGIDGGYFRGRMDDLEIYRNSVFDSEPPSPNPPQWEGDAPAGLGLSDSVIVVSAAAHKDLGNDASVQYRFEATRNGQRVAISEWVNHRSYRFGGLKRATEYQFRFQARDAAGNATTWSDTIHGLTLDEARPVIVQPKDPKAVLHWEAERYIRHSPGPNGNRWEQRTAAPAWTNASLSGTALELVPNKNKQYDDPADAAVLEYLVHIRHPGRYRLFFYGGGLSPKDNSVQMGIDGVYPIQLSNLKLKEGKYIWFGRAMAVNDHPWIVFPQAGLYRFTVHGREDGTWLDRLALSPESRGTKFPTLNEAMAEIEETDNVERK